MLTKEEVLSFGYFEPRLMPTGEWACIGRFAYTCGLIIGVTGWGYDRRFCYETFGEAKAALITWTGRGDPPGAWIKEKGGRVERSNPNLYMLKGIPIVPEPVIPRAPKRDMIEELIELAKVKSHR